MFGHALSGVRVQRVRPAKSGLVQKVQRVKVGALQKEGVPV